MAQRQKLIQIVEVAKQAGIHLDEIRSYGSYKAKVPLKLLDRIASRSHGRLICITAITPTKAGEGKTCTAIGLTQALGLIKKRVILCLREPSMAPMFGYKGGATGGGFSQVMPMEEINLHFTGDIHAVTMAHNLLAAVIDNHIHHGNVLNIDPEKIFWRRSLDISDRQLRTVQVGLSKASKGERFKTGFDITAASEVMAILSLSTGLGDLKARLAKITAALSKNGDPITAEDLKVSNAMALLLKDAIEPNLVQTMEGQPVFMHTGTFANVSHGNSSVLAMKIALKLAPYVVTEAGFAADMGFEKFCHIVSRVGEIKPSVAVLVVSLRALKSHSTKLSREETKLPMVFKDGLANLNRHISIIQKFGVGVVAAINRFDSDKEEELSFVCDYLKTIKIPSAVSEVFSKGGEGGIALAEEVIRILTHRVSSFKPLYDLSLPVEEKISCIAKEVYGANGVAYSAQARQDLAMIKRLGWTHHPVNIAKTPYSFTDNPNIKGAPNNFRLHIREIKAYTGAGYLVAIAGKIMLMPGLPEHPSLEKMDISNHGKVTGLF